MAQMTEDDCYELHVYPQGRKATLVFIGACWDVHNYELTYNGFVGPILNHYAPSRVTWADRETIAEGFYQFTWEKRALDIKGDG